MEVVSAAAVPVGAGRTETSVDRVRRPPTTPDRNREIVGTPIGRDALLSELKSEMIAYTPEELIDLAGAKS